MYRDTGQAAAAVFQIPVDGITVAVGDVQEDVLAADGVRFDAVELVADGRCDLVPGLAGAHDRVHLVGPQAAGRGAVGSGGAGVGIATRQYFSRSGQSVLGDNLMADAMPADVIEAPDTEVGDELPGLLTAGGVSDRRCRYGVVHHHR